MNGTTPSLKVILSGSNWNAAVLLYIILNVETGKIIELKSNEQYNKAT